jgi:hypothetical protein
MKKLLEIKKLRWQERKISECGKETRIFYVDNGIG